ncbi:MAG TPA: M48 family metalloprotease, partial [Pyrinomonadaceae bacterium]|nr:M48 family metalloprotease [Pyrinomonadaceae bacterium]
HEFGHLSGKHGSFSGWIYRVRQTWIQILTRVHEERSYASFLFEPFLKWYAPYLNAYSFVLARAQEREADVYSVDLAGKNVAAVALTRLTTKQRVLSDEFWPTFFRGAKEQSLAPRDTFTQMLSGIEQSVGHARAQKWFLEALRVPTGYEDTHPALGDRLAAIGFRKDSPELKSLLDAVVKADQQNETAAARYLRQLPEDFEPSMNRLWRERIATYWNDRHEEIKKTRKRLNELDEQAKTRSLTVEEQWERAVALGEIEDRAASLPAIKALLQEVPDHVGANFALGSMLLEDGNADGVSYLEKTFASDAEVAAQGCELISDFYLQQGNEELAETYSNRAAEYFDKALKVRTEAMNFSRTDKFEPHDLDQTRLQKLETQLKTIRGLNAAFLVRKLIEDAGALYVLAVMAAPTWKDGQNAMHIDQLFEDLSTNVELPSPIVMISLDGERAYLINPISSVPRAQVFATPEAGVTYRH